MAKSIQTGFEWSNSPEFTLMTNNSPRIGGKLQLRSNPMICCRIWKGSKTERPVTGGPGDAYYYRQLHRLVSAYSDAYNHAFRNFKQRAWNGSQVQTLVSLAEARQSLDMVTGLAGRLVSGARLIRKGHFLAAARYFQLADVPHGASKSRQFLDNWMAYRYGWVPTISDLYNHADAIKNPPKDSYVIARGSGSWSNRTVPYDSKMRSSGAARVTIKARVVVSNPVLARLNQFGVLNPLEVAWELVPYSFVVDWFVGVGDYLSNLSAFVGLKLVDCSTTYAVKSHCWHVNSEDYTYDIVAKQRVVSDVLSNPPIQWGSGLNPKRAMDSLAILQNLLRSR